MIFMFEFSLQGSPKIKSDNVESMVFEVFKAYVTLEKNLAKWS